MKHARNIAEILLEKQAVTLNLDEPYTYASGIRSPIYCDNRRLMFFPDARKTVCGAFCEEVAAFNPDVIAGTATSAVPWAAWAASCTDKPMVYIRKAAKGYGKEKLIEGGDIQGKTVVVLEDLVSTGGSSLNAVRACQEAGGAVLAMIAIFTYEFADAPQKFAEAGCEIRFLTNFSALIQAAAARGALSPEQLAMAQAWNRDPQNWGPRHGFPNAASA